MLKEKDWWLFRFSEHKKDCYNSIWGKEMYRVANNPLDDVLGYNRGRGFYNFSEIGWYYFCRRGCEK